MTFSICAFDAETGELGIAVQSKFLGVGAVVPWARAGVGAVATQSFANTSYGPLGLSLLAEGLDPRAVGERLVAEDREREKRQFGIVDARGRAFSYTGKECFDWAGGATGKGYAVQGNILAGPAVVEGMAEAFEMTAGALADRLVAALHGGQRFGGDRRGMQSAALLVVKEKGGYGGFNDRFIDLHVEDHPRPIDELERLLALYKLYFKIGEQRFVPIDAALARELQGMLGRSGRAAPSTGRYDDETRSALRDLFGIENLEERWSDDPQIDEHALRFLRTRFRA